MYRALALATVCLACTGAQPPKTPPATSSVGPPSAGVGAPVPPAASSETPDLRSASPFVALIDVGGVRLHIRCAGIGEPLVVFEAGLGLDGATWRLVQPEVSRLTRACAYDRAGRGLSGPARYPRGQRQMAEELHTLLKSSGHRGPYVLVGHSMGGANARWFLHAHPQDVAGMVLVDAATEDWPSLILPRVPAEALPEFWSNLRAWEGIEAQAFVTGYRDLRTSAVTLGNRPLVILTAGKPENELGLRKEMQDKLKRLSSNGVQVLVRDSSHNIQLDSPATVIRSVRAVVTAVRTGSQVSEVDLLNADLRSDVRRR